MDCPSCERAVHCYLDGELDPSGCVEFERHVTACADCAARLRREQALQSRIRDAAVGFRAPQRLHAKIQSSLDETQSTPARLYGFHASWMKWSAMAVAVVLCGVFTMTRKPAPAMPLARQVRDCHVRSLMAGHLTDVASSDQHTVKPWFAGRLDFSPWVADLPEAGFHLQGGRLDYLDDRPVAALVFQRREHRINLFTWPSTESKSDSVTLDRLNGYQILHWSAAGMTFWAVSDLNFAELQDFAALIRSRTSLPPPTTLPQMPSPTAKPAVQQDPR